MTVKEPHDLETLAEQIVYVMEPYELYGRRVNHTAATLILSHLATTGRLVTQDAPVIPDDAQYKISHFDTLIELSNDLNKKYNKRGPDFVENKRFIGNCKLYLEEFFSPYRKKETS